MSSSQQNVKSSVQGGGQTGTRRSAIELLRIGIGVIWVMNLVFVVDPRNNFFGTFSQTALSYAPTTAGGPGLANFVSGNPAVFSLTIALVTGYLAIALLLGLTTRLACYVGIGLSAVLLITQVGSTFLLPGGTDVGPHPLYLLVYTILILGGAGQTLSVDSWISQTLAAQRASRLRPEDRSNQRHVPGLTKQFLAAYLVSGILVSFAIGFGLVVAAPISPASSGPAPYNGPTNYLNLTVVLNPANGMPQYLPANFTVPQGKVIISITDTDTPFNWPVCPCNVTGTSGNVEWLNGSPIHHVDSSNVAHTFVVPSLGIRVLSPGQSTINFTVFLNETGSFVWICIMPCGQGADPYNSPPMGVPGYMLGTLTVI